MLQGFFGHAHLAQELGGAFVEIATTNGRNCVIAFQGPPALQFGQCVVPLARCKVDLCECDVVLQRDVRLRGLPGQCHGSFQGAQGEFAFAGLVVQAAQCPMGNGDASRNACFDGQFQRTLKVVPGTVVLPHGRQALAKVAVQLVRSGHRVARPGICRVPLQRCAQERQRTLVVADVLVDKPLDVEGVGHQQAVLQLVRQVLGCHGFAHGFVEQAVVVELFRTEATQVIVYLRVGVGPQVAQQLVHDQQGAVGVRCIKEMHHALQGRVLLGKVQRSLCKGLLIDTSG